MSVTLQFQSTGMVPGNAQPVRMLGPSLTIGRGPENDLVLPDPDRMVSKTHCVIEDHGGRIFAIDLSTNGTFLNYSKVPMGREPTPINNGDVLSLGPYELVVEITDFADDLLPPVDLGQVSHGSASAAPDPLQLLDDAAPGGDFLDSLLGDPKGPTGPRNLKIGQFDPDALLPPLDEDAVLLGPRPVIPDGPAMRDHSAAATDAFRPAEVRRSVIPDDWEDDLLAPSRPPVGTTGQPFGGSPFGQPASPAPFPPPVQPPAPAGIPDDFEDLLSPGAPAPVQSAPGPDLLRPSVSPFVTVPPAPTAPPLSVPPVAPEPTARPITSPPAFAAATQPPARQPTTPPAMAPAPAPAPTPAAAPAPYAPTATGAEAEAIRAFMAGLGMSNLRLTDEELILTMSRLGSTLREMITGLREILMTRSSIKSEFRMEQTMISAGKNNPLKFSVSAELAVEAMTRPSLRGYLDADEAAREALDDVKAHEIGMVTGMEAALKGVLARLDPAVLTGKIESTGGISAMFRGKKAQYWETYEKMYAEISDQAENDFHDLFAREFSQAYKDQLKRLKDAKG